MSLLDDFKNAAGSLLTTATDVYKAKLQADAAKDQAKEAAKLAAQQRNIAAEAARAEAAPLPSWVKPVAIGAGVIVALLIVVRLLPKK